MPEQWGNFAYFTMAGVVVTIRKNFVQYERSMAHVFVGLGGFVQFAFDSSLGPDIMTRTVNHSMDQA